MIEGNQCAGQEDPGGNQEYPAPVGGTDKKTGQGQSHHRPIGYALVLAEHAGIQPAQILRAEGDDQGPGAGRQQTGQHQGRRQTHHRGVIGSNRRQENRRSEEPRTG